MTALTKSALVISGGWPGHSPRKTGALIATWLRSQQFEVVSSTRLSCLDDLESLSKYDLIVPNWTMGQPSDIGIENLAKVVHDGCGLAGIHGGMGDTFRSSTKYQFIVGGQFVAHPGDHLAYVVNIVGTHPIVSGLNDFGLTSEQYYMHVDPGNRVLATTTYTDCDDGWISGTVMPVAWTRRYGSGRIFYCSIGHSSSDLLVPEVTIMIQRGLLWVARR